MKKVIRFSNNAPACSDIKCSELATTIVFQLQKDQFLDVEISYSNQVFLDCLRAEILKVDYRLNNKISWFVEDIEVHFDKYLRSGDIWRLLPNISEKSLFILVNVKKYIQAIDSNANM